jgi:hypothetical protein
MEPDLLRRGVSVNNKRRLARRREGLPSLTGEYFMGFIT